MQNDFFKFYYMNTENNHYFPFMSCDLLLKEFHNRFTTVLLHLIKNINDIVVF